MSPALRIRRVSPPISDKFSISSPVSPSCSCEVPEVAPASALYEISAPFGMRHEVHVRYNVAEARFEGIPEHFLTYLATQQQLVGGAVPPPPVPTAPATKTKRSRAWSHSREVNVTKPPPPPTTEPLLLNQQFNLSYRHVPRVSIPGYNDRIPAVLLMLQQHFHSKQGVHVPHIFRESPNKQDRDQAMREINLGIFSGTHQDVRIIADLIKVWFRELPIPIFHQIPSDQLERLSRLEEGVVEQVEQMIGSLELCIIYWLADLLVEVSEYQEENHMGIDQLAIVMAPNLIRIETENPMVAVTLSKASVQVFQWILRSRLEERRKVALVRHQSIEIHTNTGGNPITI